MKEASPYLYELIQSLTVSEKRYFTLYAQRHYAQGSKYLSLFAIMSEQKVYDEVKAIKAMAISKNNYAVQKSILYQQLLDALLLYHKESNTPWQLQDAIHACHLLLNKGLLEQAQVQYRKLQKHLRDFPLLELHLQLQELEILLYSRTGFKHISTAALDQWHSAMMAIGSQLEAEAYYRHVHSSAQKIQLEAGGRGAKQALQIKALLAQPAASMHLPHLTARGKLDLLQTQALAHFVENDTAAAMAINLEFLSLLESQPQLLAIYPERYFSALNNYLIDCFVLGLEDQMQAGIATMRGLETNSAFKKVKHVGVNIFRITYQLELNYRLSMGDFAAAAVTSTTVEREIETYKPLLPLHHYLNLVYLCAYSHFCCGEYHHCSRLLDMLQQHSRIDTPDILLNVAALVQVVCHYELGNMIIIDSLVKSTKRLLQQDKQSISNELELLNSMLHFSTHVITDKDWAKTLAKVNSSGLKSSIYMQYFDYTTYIYSKVYKLNYHEAWKQRKADGAIQSQ